MEWRSEVCILSPDTDVFLLLIQFYPQLCASTIFRTGKTTNIRDIDIDIGIMYETLGPSHAEALLGFHAFTGCDQTGRFFGKLKKECFKIFIAYSHNDLLPFLSLGRSSSSILSNKVHHGLQKFVLDMYCERRLDNISSPCSQIKRVQNIFLLLKQLFITRLCAVTMLPMSY